MAQYRTVGMRLDIESRSRADIKVGSYVYSECPDFRVLLLSYAMIREYPGGVRKISRPRPLDLTRPNKGFWKLILDPDFEKHAYNANFERICLSRHLGMPTGTYIDPAGWYCTAILANTSGIFGTLDEVSRAVRSPARKDAKGKALINLFSKPQRDGEFVDPADRPVEFAQFSDYCDQDVLTEAVVASRVPPIESFVQAEYEADQRINDRGFRHHKRLAVQALAQVEADKDRVMSQLRDLTGVDNPNSGPQIKAWLDEQDYPMDSLDKAHRAEAKADPICPDIVKQALTLKEGLAMTSVSKHKAALRTRCADGRIRGALQFYGAHTGREAGRGMQPQNLPRYEAPTADIALMLRGDAGDQAPRIAKGSVRASIVPARGHSLVVPDYNAIEARVLAGLAGEGWVEDEFKTGPGKIYEATASQMFGLDKAQMLAALKACDKCGACVWCNHRGKGKVSELAFGYAGGAGALVTMGAAGAGIDVGNYPELNAEWREAGMPGKFHQYRPEAHDYPELLRMRDLYRDARPATVRFWKLCAKAWDTATDGRGARFGQNQMLSMIRDGRHNRLVLPSGRSIWYRFARTMRDPENLDWVERRTFIGKASGVGHTRIDTHGGKLTENVTQAVARDILFDLIMRIEEAHAAGWPGRLVLHVHDEVVLEAPTKQADQVLADVLGMMNQPPEWGKVFAVKGEGSVMDRYKK